MEQGNPKTWAVTLMPHRSLSRRGFLIVMGFIAAANFALGLAFYMIGAWPVLGFLGLDVLAVWWAFKANFADARRAERIEITAHEMILQRMAEGAAPAEQRFVRAWARVELEENRGLFLSSKGLRTEIARFLTPDERKQLAATLRAALASPHI